MNKNAVLGALATAMLGVIAYLLFSSGASGNRGNNYAPYAQNGYVNQGQMPQGQMQQGQMQQGQMQQGQMPQGQMQQAQPVQQVQQAQPQKQIAPKQVKSSPPPAAPAPAVLQTQNMGELIALINSFGNPSGPDQTLGCYIQVQQDNGAMWTDLAVVNEQCVVTPYAANNALILTRTNGDPFFNLFGGPYSLLRLDNGYPDINLFQPKSPGMWFGNNVGPGPTQSCMVADNGSPGISNTVRITVCVQ